MQWSCRCRRKWRRTPRPVCGVRHLHADIGSRLASRTSKGLPSFLPAVRKPTSTRYGQLLRHDPCSGQHVSSPSVWEAWSAQVFHAQPVKAFPLEPDTLTGRMSPPRGGRGEIPTLHGLRAVSITVVLLAHAARIPQLAELSPFIRYGDFGVQVFFVISGYLITTLLDTEHDQRGSVSLRRFYLRRTLRIIPAYATYLLGAAIIARFAHSASPDGRWWPSLTYTSNFFLTNRWNVAHSWSLSVEEQFYLTWPIAFVMVGRRRALWIALGVLAASPVVRVAMYLATHNPYLASIWNHDFIAAGCALALVAPKLRGRFADALLRWGWLAGIIAIATFHVAYSDNRWLFVFRLTVAEGLIAILLAITIIWCIANPTSAVGRFLDSAPVRAIGILSYSIYLWQQPFLGETPLLSPQWSFVGVAVAALASYYLVERPALSLKRRFERLLVVTVPNAESGDSVRPVGVELPAEKEPSM